MYKLIFIEDNLVLVDTSDYGTDYPKVETYQGYKVVAGDPNIPKEEAEELFKKLRIIITKIT